MTSKEIYAEWKRLGGTVVDADYVWPVHPPGSEERKALDRLCDGAPSELIEALMEGGLAEELIAEGGP